MRGSELAEAMAVAVDRVVSARDGTGTLDRAIESIVGSIGRFGGKDATSYLEAYRAEMIMRDIPVDRRLSGFPRVVTPSIHAEVLEVLAGFPDLAGVRKTVRAAVDAGPDGARNKSSTAVCQVGGCARQGKGGSPIGNGRRAHDGLGRGKTGLQPFRQTARLERRKHVGAGASPEEEAQKTLSIQ